MSTSYQDVTVLSEFSTSYPDVHHLISILSVVSGFLSSFQDFKRILIIFTVFIYPTFVLVLKVSIKIIHGFTVCMENRLKSLILFHIFSPFRLLFYLHVPTLSLFFKSWVENPLIIFINADKNNCKHIQINYPWSILLYFLYSSWVS